MVYGVFLVQKECIDLGKYGGEYEICLLDGKYLDQQFYFFYLSDCVYFLGVLFIVYFVYVVFIVWFYSCFVQKIVVDISIVLLIYQ